VLEIVENLWAVVTPPRTPLGESQRSPDPLAGGEGLLPLPQNPTTRSQLPVLASSDEKSCARPWMLPRIAVSQHFTAELFTAYAYVCV